MFDIGKETVEFECPKCGNKLKTTLNDIASEKPIYCSSCDTEIHPSTDASLKKSIESANKNFKKLEKGMDKFNNMF